MENQKYHIRLNTARVMGEHTINSLPLKREKLILSFFWSQGLRHGYFLYFLLQQFCKAEVIYPHVADEKTMPRHD